MPASPVYLEHLSLGYLEHAVSHQYIVLDGLLIALHKSALIHLLKIRDESQCLTHHRPEIISGSLLEETIRCFYGVNVWASHNAFQRHVSVFELTRRLHLNYS